MRKSTPPDLLGASGRPDRAEPQEYPGGASWPVSVPAMSHRRAATLIATAPLRGMIGTILAPSTGERRGQERVPPEAGDDRPAGPMNRRDIALLFTARCIRMFGYGLLAVVLVLYLRRRRPVGRADRAAAHAHAARRRRDLALADHARRPPGTAPRPPRGRGPDGLRPGSRSPATHVVRGAPGGRHHRRHQPQRQRGRTVPRRRAGVARAARRPAASGRTCSPGTSWPAPSRRRSAPWPRAASRSCVARAVTAPADAYRAVIVGYAARRRRPRRAVLRASRRPSRSPGRGRTTRPIRTRLGLHQLPAASSCACPPCSRSMRSPAASSCRASSPTGSASGSGVEPGVLGVDLLRRQHPGRRLGARRRSRWPHASG